MENDWNLPEDDGMPETPPRKTKDVITSWAEQLAELVDTKTALKIKEKQVTLKHQYDMEALNKKHEIESNRPEELRKTIKLIAWFGLAGASLFLVFLFMLAQIGFAQIIPNILQVLFLSGAGLGVYKLGEQKGKSKKS
jgi:hypothetical protein